MAKIRTRARAVDMLGRQQIATIQNALTELFKNAHDAYAKNVRVDFFEDAGPGNEGLNRQGQRGWNDAGGLREQVACSRHRKQNGR